jgi:AcrR family transcriptional regulator
MADRETRKNEITARRQHQIVEAAAQIFARKGFAAATIPEIARLAGVASGTIYLYYPSKRELFVAVIKELIFTLPLLNLIESLSGPDFSGVLKNILQNRLDLVEGDNIAHLASLMGEIQRDPELRTLFYEKFIQPFLNRMEVLYRSQSASDGRLKPLEPAIAVRVVGGTILGFIMLKSLESGRSPVDRTAREKVVETLQEYILHGILKAGDTNGV